MSCSKEIGGYFGIECSENKPYHSSGRFLNSGRNALRHILRAYDIKQIYVPHYTCPVVIDAIKKEGCEIIFYTVTPEL